MMMLLHSLMVLPVFAFILNIVIPRRYEAWVSCAAFTTVGLHLVLVVAFIAIWLLNSYPVINVKEIVLWKSPGYEFFIDFYFDRTTAVYVLVGAMLTFLVAVYSRYYMHRESGYKRFFNTVMFFYVGYNVVIFSGNLETLFLGWEILGVSSFLLIAFYRHRYLPVKNAVKVFSIYRVGDVGIILAIWLSHHLWHENITFLKLNNYALVHTQLQSHTLVGVFISLLILVAAAAKSAQLPFSSWLPRAMEGPTPSSAIFYGSLSVHIGIYILLRTFPFWEHQMWVRVLIGAVGFMTSIVATGIARVQSSVKSQIAYSSVSQIGLIFIEVAAGFHTLALIHFAGNAFLRTYQLLVSPSVASYLIREQFYHYVPRRQTFEDSLPKKIEYTVYMLCLKEWNLDFLLYRYLWTPLKVVGRHLSFLTGRTVLFITSILFMAALAVAYRPSFLLPAYHAAPVILSALGVMMIVRSFTERGSAMLGWVMVLLNHACVVLAISFNEYIQFSQIVLYSSGVVLAGSIGIGVLLWIRQERGNITLEDHHGYAAKHPIMAFVFLLASLGVAGFPITPTFIGEDLVLSHIHEDQPFLACLTAMSFILEGLAVIRIFSRVFLGPYSESYTAALRTS
jgi:NADH-quinone oxidoreductase subunit L